MKITSDISVWGTFLKISIHSTQCRDFRSETHICMVLMNSSGIHKTGNNLSCASTKYLKLEYGIGYS